MMWEHVGFVKDVAPETRRRLTEGEEASLEADWMWVQPRRAAGSTQQDLGAERARKRQRRRTLVVSCKFGQVTPHNLFKYKFEHEVS